MLSKATLESQSVRTNRFEDQKIWRESFRWLGNAKSRSKNSCGLIVARFERDDERGFRLFRIRCSQTAGVVISVAAWDGSSVLVGVGGKVFGENDLNDDDFIFTRRAANVAFLIRQRKASIGGDATGVT